MRTATGATRPAGAAWYAVRRVTRSPFVAAGGRTSDADPPADHQASGGWAARVKKALRQVGTAVLVVVTIRVLDWLLAPALPLLVTILIIGLVLQIVAGGKRGL